MLLKRLSFTLPITLLSLSIAACDDPLGLPAPFADNVIDTVSIFALQGTPIGVPSGFDVAQGLEVRTETDQFDFAFDIDALDVSRIFPTGALGLGQEAGILSEDRDFLDIDEAPLSGYSLDSALVVELEAVFVVRSRPSVTGCPFFLGALPRYGKFRVLEIDLVERRIDLESLVNVNCGYRQLIIGTPIR